MKNKKPVNHFYIFRAETDPTFTKLEFVLLKFEGDNFSASEEIFRYDYPPGLRGPQYDFSWPNWFLTDTGQFYFPEDNFKKYSIVKYDEDGEP